MKEAVLQEVAGKGLHECYQPKYGWVVEGNYTDGTVNYNPA
jgi:hypothetical protein